MGSGLLELLRWATEDTDRLSTVGRRVVALRWILDSFGGASAASVAKRFGVHRCTLSETPPNCPGDSHPQPSAIGHGWNTKTNRVADVARSLDPCIGANKTYMKIDNIEQV